MKNLFCEISKTNVEKKYILKNKFEDNANTCNLNQELKPLFSPSEEVSIEGNEMDSLNQGLKPLFSPSEEVSIEGNEMDSLNQGLKPLFSPSEEIITEENEMDSLNQGLNRVNTFKSSINKFEENDDFKYKVNENNNLNLESNMNEKKNQLQYLYRNIINADCISIIDNSLYIYNVEHGYLKHIKKNDEEIEINKLIPKEYRERIHPNTVISIIRKLKSDPELQISNEEVNRYKEFINCKNGIVHVMSGVLIPHDKKYKFTYVINANYKPEYLNSQYKLHNFNRFIETSLEGDKEKIQLLMETISYLISGYTNAKKAFLLIGKPHTGKSVLSRLISYMIGEENVSNISMHKLGDRFSIGQYKDKKINICAEIGSVDIKNIDIFKAITGNDYLAGEYKGKDLFYYKSKIKLLFCGNQMPNIAEDELSNAFVDRLVFLKFNNSIPENEIDYQLENKLKEEVDGIFTTSIMYLRNLVANNFRFIEPKDSTKFLEYYKNKQNHIEEFTEEYCSIGEEHKVHISELYEIYKKHCRENYIDFYNSNKFKDHIMSIDDNIIKTKFRMNGENRHGFKGIGLKQK
ncbi:DNA primase family protein [Paraclostridium sordellii]|uniref:DNA primase family protein n=1 Tax=Paraclostridium sordellii TaxID=1505 RepID=UPI00096A904A|nr:phage/plasmid primase, P4 family [Paeniclostridium sordellii]